MIYCVVNANYLDSLIKVSQNKIKLARQNQKKRQEIEENLIKTLKEIGQSEQDKSRLISDQELQELYTAFKPSIGLSTKKILFRKLLRFLLQS